MRWVWFFVRAALVVIFLAYVVWRIFGPQIGMAIFERMANRVVGVDQTVDLPDGVHVYFCGTGSPLPDPSRAGPCLAVLAGDTPVIFDAGSGSMRKLARMGFPVGGTEHVFLTHLHSDHVDGLGELMLQAWIGGSRNEPLPVSGPAGTARLVAGFNEAYAVDATYRTAHHGQAIANPDGFGGQPVELVLGEGETLQTVFQSGEVIVKAFPVDHSPVEPAFGYRVDYKDRSVTISGDTVPVDALTEAAAGTDLLVHEALNKEMVDVLSQAAKRNGDAALSKVFADILDYHTSPADAARTAEAAGARMMVLTHIVPMLPTRMLHGAFLGQAGALYDGRIVIARDGLRVSLPTGRDDIRIDALLD